MGLLLEAFDAARAPEPRGPTADWTMGHAAGLAEGAGLAEARAAARHDTLSGELVQSLSDMAFGYAEARGAVLASLGPLIRLVLDRLLPEAASSALIPRLAEAVVAAAREDSARPLVLHVHPSRATALRAALDRAGDGPATVATDASLGADAARMALDGQETSLDLGACLSDLRGALSALLDDTGRKARHG